MEQARKEVALPARIFRLLHIDGSSSELPDFGSMLFAIMATDQVLPDWQYLTPYEAAVTRRVLRMIKIERAASETARASLAFARSGQAADWTACLAAETELVKAVSAV